MKFTPDLNFTNNALIQGDNINIMNLLLAKGFEEKFNLIYFDGPFNSGRVFSMPNDKLGIELVNSWYEKKNIEHYLIPENYLNDYRIRIELARKLIRNDGIFALQISQKESHYVKVLLDSIFGRENFLAEVIWKINENYELHESQFGFVHECILFYSKTNNYYKNNKVFPTIWDDTGYYNSLNEENTFYPSQKPEKLMERIIEMTTKKGDLVGDFYCGSGVFPFVAEKMNRNWISCDNSNYAIDITKSRLKKENIKVPVYEITENELSGSIINNKYIKNDFLPVSAEELKLIPLNNNQKIDIYAKSYSHEVDILNDKFNFFYQFVNLDLNDIKKETIINVKRPTPYYDGKKFSLLIDNVQEWIYFNILHIELVNHNFNRCEYKLLNQEQINLQIQSVQDIINNNWIEIVEEKEDYFILTDIFKYKYTIKKI